MVCGDGTLIDDIQKWLKKHQKNAPYYLVRMRPTEYFGGERNSDGTPIMVGGFGYEVIWKDRSSWKVKYGVFRDGMHTRYGVDTMSTLNSPHMSGFWQVRAGVIDEQDMRYMIQVMNNEVPDLPVFDLTTLKGLSE